MKQLFLLTFAVFCCNFLNAQINVSQVDIGTYNYNSLYQSTDLHFYLYGDGYYNFDADNEHQFGINANGNTVKAYHSEPYDNDQVEELILNTITDGISSAEIPTYSLPNKVSLKRSWNLVNDEDNYFILAFQNVESNDPISGCIEFHFTDNDTYIEGVSILDDYDNDWVNPNENLLSSDQQGYSHKYVWDFHNLKKDEQRFIYIPADCLADAFDIVETRAIMKVDNCDPLPENWSRENDGANPGIDQSPYYTLRSQVSNFPHDPNGIVTDPNCLSRNNEFFTVRYKIFFQNDGMDPVEDVILEFLVNTPFRSIELIESSHSCTMQWIPPANEYEYSKNVRFYFEDIFLEGTGAHDPPEYEDTYGWVTFDICFNLKVFTHLGIHCADSNVDIYFDLEPPVSATNEICRNCDISIMDQNQYACPDILPSFQESEGIQHKITDAKSLQHDDINEIQIFPNPVNELLFINVKDFAENDILKVFNSAGEVLLNRYVKEIGQSLNLADVPVGLYYISIQNEDSVKTKSFVKF